MLAFMFSAFRGHLTLLVQVLMRASLTNLNQSISKTMKRQLLSILGITIGSYMIMRRLTHA